MVLPLVLGLAGLAGLASGGSTMLGQRLQERQRQQQAERMRMALAEATAPAQLVGPRLPGVGPGQIDMQALAMNLAQQGDPMGVQMLQDQSGRAAQFGQATELQGMRDQAAMERLLKQQEFAAAQPGGPAQSFLDVPGLGAVPIEPVAVGSKEWMGLSKEQSNLSRIYDVLNEFRETLQESGTTSIGATAQKLGALRNEMINALAATTEAGALQQAELEFFGRRIPDPTRWTPEFMAQESGKLEAMADWYNSQVENFQRRARMTAGIPSLRMIPSERMAPEGMRPVDEGEIEAPGAAVGPRAARQPVKYSIDDLLRMSSEDIRAAAAAGMLPD